MRTAYRPSRQAPTVSDGARECRRYTTRLCRSHASDSPASAGSPDMNIRRSSAAISSCSRLQTTDERDDGIEHARLAHNTADSVALIL